MSKKITTRGKKNFVQEHKTELLTVGLISAIGVAVMFRFGLKQHDDFLRAEGLYEKFYTPTD